MLRFAVLSLMISFCLCDDWHDSYIEAYKESEGAVFEGPYPPSPGRMPMQMRPNMTAAVTPMMPLILQLLMIAAKIMLKFTIFKMIVKFIAVLCLFLFIPTLRLPRAMKRAENKAWKNAWEEVESNSLDSLSVFVKESLKKYKDILS